MPDYLDMMVNQSPWLMEASLIEKDIHLMRLKAFPLIYHERAFLNHKYADGVYVLTGPRQIGKSTHLKLLIQQKITEQNHENFFYFNCDLLDRKQDIVEIVQDYLNKFSSKKRRFIMLDEITSVKDSFLAIKFLIDSGHDKNLTYILTGSNTISVKKTGEYLPGRRGKGIDFSFMPISFKSYIQLLHPKTVIDLNMDAPEKVYLSFQKKLDLKQALEDYLLSGGFPRVINEYYKNKVITDDIFTIYRSWITSEIAKADKREYIAKRLLERCLISLGSDVSYNSIAQDAGVGSHNTIYEYIDFFTNSFVLSQIYNFDIDQKKINYRKNKKIYFNDPFIYAVIEAWLTGKSQQNYEYLKNAQLKSQLIENLVYLKLMKTTKEVYYYKKVNEIDFVTKDYLLEVKYQNKITPEDYKTMAKYDYKKILITKNTLEQTKDILMIPIELFLISEFE